MKYEINTYKINTLIIKYLQYYKTLPIQFKILNDKMFIKILLYVLENRKLILPLQTKKN